MLVTRTDGATKHCPFKLVLHDLINYTCETINCMAWKKAPAVPTTREEMGYCGFAGEPSQRIAGDIEQYGRVLMNLTRKGQ